MGFVPGFVLAVIAVVCDLAFCLLEFWVFAGFACCLAHYVLVVVVCFWACTLSGLWW